MGCQKPKQLQLGTSADVEWHSQRPLNPDNIFSKFADDTNLVIPTANISTRAAEIDNIAAGRRRRIALKSPRKSSTDEET